jgi:DNA invertase Pin-like site-specific DNA recombinase
MSKSRAIPTSGVITALIYTRVSSDEQAREGLSLDAQIAKCRRYAAQHGWIIGTEYQDVMAGTKDYRPAYQNLLTEARTLSAEGHRVAVVVLRLDRFGRRVLERVRCREELKSLGVSTHSVREGGEVSDLVANILASVAQDEVERLGQRVRDSFQYTTRQGFAKPGTAPFGYRWRPATASERTRGAPRCVLEVDPPSASLVRGLFDRTEHGAGLREVSRWLSRLPADIRGGRAWSKSGVRFVLCNKTYLGRLPDGHQGNWEPLISEEQFERVSRRLEEHQHMPRQATGRYLLTGLLRCPRCGGRMQGKAGYLDRRPRPSSRPPRRKPDRYTCYIDLLGASRPRHPRFDVNGPKLEAQALEQIGALLSVLDLDRQMRTRLERVWKGLSRPGPTASDERAHALKQIAEKARDRIRKLALLFADGEIDREGYELGRSQAQDDMSAVEAELKQVQPSRAVHKLPPLAEVLREVGGWTEALRAGDVSEQRAILGLLIEKLEVERMAFGKFRLVTTWTATGEALLELRARLQKAA